MAKSASIICTLIASRWFFYVFNWILSISCALVCNIKSGLFEIRKPQITLFKTASAVEVKYQTAISLDVCKCVNYGILLRPIDKWSQQVKCAIKSVNRKREFVCCNTKHWTIEPVLHSHVCAVNWRASLALVCGSRYCSLTLFFFFFSSSQNFLHRKFDSFFLFVAMLMIWFLVFLLFCVRVVPGQTNVINNNKYFMLYSNIESYKKYTYKPNNTTTKTLVSNFLHFIGNCRICPHETFRKTFQAINFHCQSNAINLHFTVKYTRVQHIVNRSLFSLFFSCLFLQQVSMTKTKQNKQFTTKTSPQNYDAFNFRIYAILVVA